MEQGQDYEKTTSPMAHAESWRILLHLTAKLDWDVTQIDIKTAFLNDMLPEEEQIYMEQLKGFEEEGKQRWICRLKKAIYGMTQAERIWNQTLDEAMRRFEFTWLKCEACIYYWKTDIGIVIAGIHMDNFLSIASTKAANDNFITQLKQTWMISELGTPKHIVGIAIDWDRPNK